jgi:hypothetical protein
MGAPSEKTPSEKHKDFMMELHSLLGKHNAEIKYDKRDTYNIAPISIIVDDHEEYYVFIDKEGYV